MPNPFSHPVVAWREFSSTLIAYGPSGLLLVAFLDSAGIPMVGGVDALLIAIASGSPGKAYLASACALIGSVLGSTFLFFLARKGGDVFLHKQISTRPGRRLHNWFQKYGLITIFIPAISPIPMPMKIPVFCAGALQVRFEYFALVLLVGRAIRYFGIAYLATHYGVQTLAYVKVHGWKLGGIVLAVAIIAMLALRLLQRREVDLGIPQ